MMTYGFFPGGDPRCFTPDPEASTDAERAQHKVDCDAWDRGERPNVNQKAPHWKGEGDDVMHVVPAGYGLGTYDDGMDDDDDDDMPPELRPHDFDPSCSCDTCYEAVVLARFRGESEPSVFAQPQLAGRARR